MKNKKILWLIIGGLDVAIVGFLFVIHIIMLANVIGKDPVQVAALAEEPTLIGYLAGHLKFYGWVFVVPLIVILILNVIGLVFYLKASGKREKITASDLTEEEKEALKKELLKDLQEK